MKFFVKPLLLATAAHVVGFTNAYSYNGYENPYLENDQVNLFGRHRLLARQRDLTTTKTTTTTTKEEEKSDDNLRRRTEGEVPLPPAMESEDDDIGNVDDIFFGDGTDREQQSHYQVCV